MFSFLGSVSFIAHGIKTSTLLWHKHLGHSSPSYFSAILSYVGSGPSNEIVCFTCATSKAHCLPLPGTLPYLLTPLDVVHLDLSRIITPPTFSGFHYHTQITDGLASYWHIFLLGTKDKAFSRFQSYAHNFKTFHSQKIKKLVSDGGEYINKAFLTWLSKKGITHQVTTLYTPEQNGVSERGNTITVERAHFLLSTAGIGPWIAPPKPHFLAAAKMRFLTKNVRCETRSQNSKFNPMFAFSFKSSLCPESQNHLIFTSKFHVYCFYEAIPRSQNYHSLSPAQNWRIT